MKVQGETIETVSSHKTVHLDEIRDHEVRLKITIQTRKRLFDGLQAKPVAFSDQLLGKGRSTFNLMTTSGAEVALVVKIGKDRQAPQLARGCRVRALYQVLMTKTINDTAAK